MWFCCCKYWNKIIIIIIIILIVVIVVVVVVVFEALQNRCFHQNLTSKIRTKFRDVSTGFFNLVCSRQDYTDILQIRNIEAWIGYNLVSAFWGNLYGMWVYSDAQFPFVRSPNDVLNRAWSCVHQWSSIHSWSSALSSPMLPLSQQRREAR